MIKSQKQYEKFNVRENVPIHVRFETFVINIVLLAERLNIFRAMQTKLPHSLRVLG